MFESPASLFYRLFYLNSSFFALPGVDLHTHMGEASSWNRHVQDTRSAAGAAFHSFSPDVIDGAHLTPQATSTGWASMQEFNSSTELQAHPDAGNLKDLNRRITNAVTDSVQAKHINNEAKINSPTLAGILVRRRNNPLVMEGMPPDLVRPLYSLSLLTPLANLDKQFGAALMSV